MLKREYQVSVRCTKEEREQIISNAERANQSVREFILHRSLPIRENNESLFKEVWQLTYEVKQISHMLNIITRNTSPNDQSLHNDIKQCYQALNNLGVKLDSLIKEVQKNGHH